MNAKVDFTYLVRVWITVVSVVNVGDSLQCFIDNSLLPRRIYTLTPDYGKTCILYVEQFFCIKKLGLLSSLLLFLLVGNPAFGRIYGIFLFLLAALRLSCAIDIHNKR